LSGAGDLPQAQVPPGVSAGTCMSARSDLRLGFRCRQACRRGRVSPPVG